MKYKIKTLNNIAKEGLNLFTEDFQVSGDETTPEGIVVRSAKVNTDEYPGLLAVARAGAGVNNITVDKATEKGVCVFNTPGANANAVKELVFIMLGNVARNVFKGMDFCQSLNALPDDELSKKVEKGKSNYKGFELANKTLGVLGLGKIGVLVANGGVERGMNVYGFDPHPAIENVHTMSPRAVIADTLNEVLANSDILSLHFPLSTATRGIVNKAFLKTVRDGCILVNFARGPIVEEDAICEALDSGKLMAYITDFSTQKILNHDNAICTPHLGASTEESEDNCATMAVSAMKSYLKLGHITHSVNFPTIESPPDSAFTTRLIVINRDVPNMIGWISNILGDRKINIESYRNESNGKIGYNIVDLKSEVPEDLIAQIQQNTDVIKTRVINF